MTRRFETGEQLAKHLFSLVCIAEENYRDGDEFRWNVKNDFDDPKFKFTIKQVDSHGGEDEGSEYWQVYEILDETEAEIYYLKFEGYYDSWNGTEWTEEPRFVKPVERVVTFYE